MKTINVKKQIEKIEDGYIRRSFQLRYEKADTPDTFFKMIEDIEMYLSMRRIRSFQ